MPRCAHYRSRKVLLQAGVLCICASWTIDTTRFLTPPLHRRELRRSRRVACNAYKDVSEQDRKFRVERVREVWTSEVELEKLARDLNSDDAGNKIWQRDRILNVMKDVACEVWSNCSVELVGSAARGVATIESDIDLNIKSAGWLSDDGWSHFAHLLQSTKVMTNISINEKGILSGYIFGTPVDVAHNQRFNIDLERYPTLMSEEDHVPSKRTDTSKLLEQFYSDYPSAKFCVVVLTCFFYSLPGIIIEGIVKRTARSRAHEWGGYQADTSGCNLFKEVVVDIRTAQQKQNIRPTSPLQYVLKDSSSAGTNEKYDIEKSLGECAYIAESIMSDVPISEPCPPDAATFSPSLNALPWQGLPNPFEKQKTLQQFWAQGTRHIVPKGGADEDYDIPGLLEQLDLMDKKIDEQRDTIENLQTLVLEQRNMMIQHKEQFRQLASQMAQLVEHTERDRNEWKQRRDDSESEKAELKRQYDNLRQQFQNEQTERKRQYDDLQQLQGEWTQRFDEAMNEDSQKSKRKLEEQVMGQAMRQHRAGSESERAETEPWLGIGFALNRGSDLTLVAFALHRFFMMRTAGGGA